MLSIPAPIDDITDDTIMKGVWNPTIETRTPAPSPVTTSPSSVGNISRPDVVAVAPLTAWNQRGSYEGARIRK